MTYLTYSPLLTCFVGACFLLGLWWLFEGWAGRREARRVMEQAIRNREQEIRSQAVLAVLQEFDLKPGDVDSADYQTFFRNLKEIQ